VPGSGADDVRRVLTEAGHREAGGDSLWGFEATPGTRPGIVRLRYVRDSNLTRREGSVRFGNDRVSEYVRVLQRNGFRCSRVSGVRRSVDTLLVLESPPASHLDT
jgi:hypothetical protein